MFHGDCTTESKCCNVPSSGVCYEECRNTLAKHGASVRRAPYAGGGGAKWRPRGFSGSSCHETFFCTDKFITELLQGLIIDAGRLRFPSRVCSTFERNPGAGCHGSSASLVVRFLEEGRVCRLGLNEFLGS